MIRRNLYKYILIILFLQSLIVNANSREINYVFYKLGYVEKERYRISVSYSNYYNNNNFTIIDIVDNNLSNIGYDLYIQANSIIKKSNGIHTEFGVYIIPPLKLFLNYNYNILDTEISYTIPNNSFISLNKDYSNKHVIRSEEHTLMSGFKLLYEYELKKFIPYINLISAIGMTASSNYESIFYSLNLALQTGLIYKINQNITLNCFTGIDYTSLYNGSYIIDRFVIMIPENYLVSNAPFQNINAEFTYKEKYFKNLNMLLGLELNLYKHYNLFISSKFINTLFINVGIKFKW